MRYILLLRGVNVGGKNKVAMAELKDKLSNCGFENVQSYINSGNLFFDADISLDNCHERVKSVLNTYDFDILYTLFDDNYYKDLCHNLPAWWFDDLARRDVLFMTNTRDFSTVKKSIKSMTLNNELVHFANEVVFWGKIDEKEYLKTAYHKELIKKDFYNYITIRNGKTFDKLGTFL